MSVYEELMNENTLKEQEDDPKKRAADRANKLMKQNTAAMRRGGSGVVRSGSGKVIQTDSTEYEGPSLAEQLDFIKTFLEGVDEGRVGDFFKKHKKKLAGLAMAGVMATSLGTSPDTGDKTKMGGKNGTGHSPHSQEIRNENPARRLRRAQNSSTEYEGPSLSEQADFIKTFLEQHRKPVPGEAEEKAKEKERGTWRQGGSRPSSRRPSATDPGSTLGQ